ncbi:hypothetical protein HHI36_016042 [Cryptolaemus montrouzieri]|uniref:Uncharacterized protein n=1 Tax=Cryptolaemus montrouzieri TaxID=559131 RepID=A0ABD2N879_9CUCU
MSADQELNSVLMRRQEINEALDNGDSVKLTYRVVNVYTEFHEFSRKEIKQYEAVFKNPHLIVVKIHEHFLQASRDRCENS